MTSNWTLEEGLRLVRALQEGAKSKGFHITVGGGVLNKGYSEKDLDLYFLPLNNPKSPENVEGLLDWLEDLWGRFENIGSYPEEKEPQTVSFDLETISVRAFWTDTITVSDDGRYTVQAPPRTRQVPTFQDVSESNYVKAPSKYKEVFRFKLKFNRSGGDRIDVFIL